MRSVKLKSNFIAVRIVGVAFILAVCWSCVETGKTSSEQEAEISSIITAPKDTTITDDGFEAISLLGTKLYPPEIPSRTQRLLEANLQEALNDFNQNPDSLENIIWYGRRLAYLYRLKESIKVYSDGLAQFPDSYRLLRHRGHRYISLRDFDRATQDLEQAAFLIRGLDSLMIEPDGAPNKLNRPLSNTQFNIWYHLGLAYYLKGNYDKAISAYKKCMEVSNNDDLVLATTDWLYMTYRKTGNVEAAKALIEPIKKRMNVIENDAYHKRILMYKGDIDPTELIDLRRTNDPGVSLKIATQGYGVANWYLYNGEVNKARQLFEKIVEGTSWTAFGYIAAEVDLANLNAGGL
ncbi:MAG: tetratricopeptide repeat protein [Cyclobacteriaceae bacterium]